MLPTRFVSLARATALALLGTLMACGAPADVPQNEVVEAPDLLSNPQLDSRFGTYEQAPTDRAPAKLPFRVGQAGYADGADFITVGKLDGASVGPFGGITDSGEIGRRWTLLRVQKPVPNYNRWYSWITWFDSWGEVYSVQAYERIVGTLVGDNKTPFYMKDVLQQQLNAEAPLLADMVRKRLNWLDANEYPLIKRPADAIVVRPVRFEVANEPNAYPYMPPKLYAWYYLKWRQLILGAVNSVNSERRAAHRSEALAQVMPAGLWIWDGIPSGLTSFLDKGISAEILGITLSMRIMTNTRQYLQAVLDAMKQPLFCEEKLMPSAKGERVTRYCNDNLGNVTITKWTYKDDLGRTTSSQTLVGGKNYYAFPAEWTVTPASKLIDVGNLHFYPWLGVHSTMDLDAQWENLRSLTNLAASNASTGKVWLTELGNFNPWPSSKVVSDLMTPVLGRLAASNIPQIEKWYWFKNVGSDSKLDDLKSVPSTLDLAANEILYALWKTILELIPGVRLPDLPSADQQTQILDFLHALGARRPPQGLFDNPPELMGPTGLTPIGRYYYSQASRVPLALPPAARPRVAFQNTAGELFTTDEWGNPGNVAKIAGSNEPGFAVADTRVGVRAGDGSVRVLEGPATSSFTQVWTPGAASIDFDASSSWHRVAVLLSSSDFYVHQGALDGGFTYHGSGVRSFALGEDRYTLLKHDGSAYINYGGLDTGPRAFASGVKSVATVGNRTVVLTNGNVLFGTEDRWGAGLVQLAQNVRTYSLARDRVAVIGTDGHLRTAEGRLAAGAAWTDQLLCQSGQNGPRVFCPVDAVVLTRKRMVATVSGTLMVKDDVAPAYGWQIAAGSVDSFDASGDRIAAAAGGEFGVRDGWIDNWGDWAILGEGVKAYRMAKEE